MARLRDAISSLTQGGPYAVTRTTDGGYDANGLAVAGSTSTLSAAGSLQPVTGRQLRDLPEGQRGDEVLVLYTLTELRSRNETHAPDKIVIASGTWAGTWVVTKVERFDAFDDTHFRVYITRGSKP